MFTRSSLRGSLGLVEITGLSASLVALDVLDKASDVTLLQVELNDQLGALIKIAGEPGAVSAAVAAAEFAASEMHAAVVARVIHAPAGVTGPAVESGPERNAMLDSDVVFIPGRRPAGVARAEGDEGSMADSFALGFIETQGLTAVLEALDAAAKAASVEVIGKEKLGGGYVTVIIKGDVAAVRAAVDAGRERVESLNLGKVIATHVIARPSEAVLSILPTL